MKGEKGHILCIEEDLFLVDIYKRNLEMEGFKVTTVRDGEMGLHTIKKKKPDIVVLDLLISKMDGFAVLESIKSDPQTKYIPVIIMTSLGQKNDVDRCSDLGVSDYLIKTHDQLSELINSIKNLLK